MKHLHLLLLLWPIAAQTQPTPYQWYLQTGLSVIPPYTFYPSMAYDTVRGVTLYIPQGQNGEFGGTWRWDGSEWIQPTDASSTEHRFPAGIVFDTSRGVAVLFCNQGDFPTPGHTWEWDGSVWRLAATNGPGSRSRMGMAFDSHRGRTVLFGGADGIGAPIANTWEWDGSRWRVVATNGPTPRYNGAMAYDAKRRVTVWFGGMDVFDIRRRDTWTWDGTNWTPVAVAGPTARALHAMTYDSVREKVLLYGGWGEDDPIGQEGLGDLWEWDGSQWTLASANSPGHYRAAMAFDSRRGEAVLFGGERHRIDLTETWLLKLHETWVDFGYAGVEAGVFDLPFNTLSEGVNVAPSGSVVKVKTGVTSETLTISKRLSVEAIGGAVIIGR